jgi:hypothetical protein
MSASEDLRRMVRETVEAQIRAGDPAEVGLTLDRLVRSGYTVDEAKTLIGCALSAEFYDMLDMQLDYSPRRYLDNLERLPALPLDTPPDEQE